MQIFGFAAKKLLHRNLIEAASAEIIHKRFRLISKFNGRGHEVQYHSNGTMITNLLFLVISVSSIQQMRRSL